MKLFDTDVLIWYLKGNANASKLIGSETKFGISVISYIELMQGMRNKTELQSLKRTLQKWPVSVLYINEDISAHALLYVEKLFLSHAVELPDAFIGATATNHKMTLVTGNIKHYRAIPNINLEQFNP